MTSSLPASIPGPPLDGADGSWDEPGNVPEAMREIEAMHDQGRGVIGMKMIGGGHFADAEDRERALRYAMQCGFVDSVVVGFASRPRSTRASTASIAPWPIDARRRPAAGRPTPQPAPLR